MSLGGVLNVSSSGLESVGRRIATVSQNVANAGTAGYVRQTVSVTSATAGGQGMGVRTGPATRTVDDRLQADMLSASADAVGQRTRSAALASIDAASGTPGSGSDLPSLLGALRDAFTALQSDPANAVRQRSVIDRADTLARGLGSLAGAASDARQAAQDAAVADVTTANDALQTIGTLSKQIIEAMSRDESTADLEDQRDRSIRTLTDLTGARVLRQANGDVLAIAGGLVLPTGGGPGPLALASATLAPGTLPAAPQVSVDGVPAGGEAFGGRIGANLALRDGVLPAVQDGLDGFAQSLAARFNLQGLALFTDPAGAVPAVQQAGFARTIRVSDAVRAAPAMLRDGVAPAGAAGSTVLIDRLLDRVLGSGSGSLAAAASRVAGSHASLAAQAASSAETTEAVQRLLDSKLTEGTGVSLDTETADLVRLQNAYAANAKVIAAAQAMWTQLLDSVR